jgi:hypothetical protein
MSYASNSTAESVQPPPMADQRAQAEQRIKEKLDRLLPNPSLPSERSWQLIGKITLLQLSPFKVSTAQMLSLDAFSAEPWPKQGAQVDDSLEKLQQELFLHMRSNPISGTEAAGLIVVLATFASRIRDKVAWLLSPEFEVMLVESQWNWSEGDRCRLTKDIDGFVDILGDEAWAWCSSIIKLLIEGRRQLDGAAHEGDPKGLSSSDPDVIDPADYWEWLASYFSKAFSGQARPVSLNTQSISVATKTSESQDSIKHSMNSWLSSFKKSMRARSQSATTMGTSVSGTEGKT